MKSFLIFSTLIVLAAAIATYARYGSFDPCQWMEQELAQESGLPRLVVRARIHGEFLLQGIADPYAGECITAWWDYRADGLPKGP